MISFSLNFLRRAAQRPLATRDLHPHALKPATRRLGRRAFSLMELLSVMAVISIITGISMPAVKGLTGANSLDVGARKIADLLSLARSEAIARHAVVRFAVAREWSGKESDNLRKVSLWVWNAELERFFQLSPWSELPSGTMVESSVPDYLRAAAYAADDASIVRGDCVLESEFAERAEFNAGTETEPIAARFIEFLPSGNARIPGSSARRAIFVTAQGFPNSDGSVTYTAPAEGRAANWAQINVDTLTGRVHVYQP